VKNLTSMRNITSSFTSTTLFAFLACLICCAPKAVVTERPTVVYVVRHAEKLDPADQNSPLSAAGHERAAALSTTLARSGVQRIYATTLQRTQQTVAPLATLLDIAPVVLEPGAVEDLVMRITSGDRGLVVLVAGHSNTVPRIVQGLSGIAVDGIPEERFDRLFKVMIPPDGAATVEELRYGAPTP